MASSASIVSDKRPVHIPRLKYRQNSHDVLSAETASITSSQPSVPTLSTPSAESGFRLPSSYSQSTSSSDSNSRQPSIATTTSLAPPQTPDKHSKRRKGFLSSLFSVKEPSAQALADYEKHLKTQGALKNGRRLAVGIPGVSSAKLPSTVPKVNSNWDGTPQTAKEGKKRESASQSRLKVFGKDSTSEQSLPSSTSSFRTAARRPKSKRTLGGASVYTTHSDGSRNQLADLYGWEIAEFSGRDDGKTSRPGTKGGSVRSMPTYTSQGLATEPPLPPEIPKVYAASSPPANPLSPNPPAHSHSPSLTPTEESPPTPTEHSPVMNLNSAESEKTLHEHSGPPHHDMQTTVIEAPANANGVIIRSSGVDVLSPPSTAKWTPKASTFDKSNDDQAEKLRKEPKSILKRNGTPSLNMLAQQSPGFDPLCSKPTVLDSSPQSSQWKPKMQFRSHDTAGHKTDGKGTRENATTPTPESGSLLQRRKSKIGMFKQSQKWDYLQSLQQTNIQHQGFVT